MLKTLSTKSDMPKKGGVGVGRNSKAGCNGNELDEGEVEDDEFRKNVQKMSKFKNLSKSQKTVGSLDFLTLGAKLAFTKLRQPFLKAPIFYYFNPK